MKTSSNIYVQLTKSVRHLTDFTNNIKIFLILFLLVGTAKFSPDASGQCPGHNGPSCNFFGPLVACVGTSSTDTITVSYGSTLPEFTFKFLINGSGGSTNGIVTPFGGFADSTFQGTVVIDNGTSSGSEDIQVTVYVTFADGCTDSTICTKSVTVIDVEATTQFQPIKCVGGTTTLQVTGSGGAQFQYTLLPGGPTNNTGSFPGLTAGTYSVLVQGESFVEKTDTCSKIITGINIPDGTGGPVFAKCPAAINESACTSPSTISADFAAWKAAFHDSAAAKVTITGNPIHFSSSSAPDACTGGTVTGIDSVFSTCDTSVCTSTFSVAAAPSVSLTCPLNFTDTVCHTQAQINADFTAWLAKAKVSGGCNGNLTNNNTGAPNACSGGTATVTFTYTSTCAPLTSTCTATFSVPASPAVLLTCPLNKTESSCLTQTQVNNDFNAWLATASAGGGCNGQLTNNSSTHPAPNACSGGTATVTFTYTSTCAPLTSTCTATFSVPASPAVLLTCPQNKTESSCLTQAQVNSDFTTWLATASASGGCNGVLTNNSTTAPNACSGGTATVTFTYTSTCAPLTSTCTATFSVPASPAVLLTCPQNKTESSCLGQAQVNSDFTAWLATASASGGCNGVLTNNSPTAPNACSGGTATVTFTYTSTCAPLTSTCTATFSVPASPAVLLTCPQNKTESSCLGQAQVNSNFTAWLATASASGGCNGALTNNSTTAPNACSGGTATVTFTYTSTCAPLISTCTATFSVPASPAVLLTCPQNKTESSCLTQAQVNSDFTTWLATASASGGCNGVLTNNSTTAPNACSGGTATITFTYTSTCAPLTSTCTATFSVPASPAVLLTCPQNKTESSCLTQAQVNSDFTTWLATASASGGCNGQLTNNSSTHPAPDACTGGSTTVTFTYTSTCAPNMTTCTATFSVPASPAVLLTCPQNKTESSCLTQAQVNSDFAAWLATAKGSGGCNGVGPTNNNTGAPDACAGGTATVTFTYTSTCAPLTSTCTATFTVPASPAVLLTCPQNKTESSCLTQTQVNNDFNAWLATASANGGCNGQLANNSETHPAPNACSGGTATVTFTYTSTCAPLTSTCTATFSVPASPAVLLTCPQNKTEGSCLTQAQVNSDFTTWLATASASGGCNGALTNNSTTAPNACSGGTATVTFTYTSTCAPLTSTCTATFSVPASPAVLLTCPQNKTEGSCLTQSQVNSDFTAWLATASASGGCNGVLTNNSTTAPNACSGGTATVIFTYTSTCAPLTSTCTATFSVPASPAVLLTCPQNKTEGSCLTQAQVNSDFTAWLATASASGGCNGALTNNSTTAPNACSGGTATVTFTYSSTCAPLTSTCTATFSVPASPTVLLTCPQNKTETSCLTQAQVNSDFTTWLATASASGGCNGVLTNNSSTAPNACSGGTATVTFTYTSTCAPLTSTCTAHFTVTASPALSLTIPNDTTVACCQTQAAVNAEFAAWVAEVKFGGGCGTKLTTTGNQAPPNCGGSQLVTFTVTDTICGATKSLSATFNVPAPPPLTMSGPPDTTVLGTQLQAAITAEYLHWLTEVSGGGGTGGTKITNNGGNTPPVCAASITVTFIITDTICPASKSVTATFTVGPCPSFWGCTLGFWKNHTSIWNSPGDPISACLAAAIAVQGYSGDGTSGSSFASTFGLTSAEMTAVGLSPTLTLEGALESGGGGYKLLVRQGVAALINTCGLSGHYTYTSAYVLTSIHMAIITKSPSPLGDEFGNANEVQPDNCPPGGPAHKRLMNDAITLNDNVTISAYPNPFNDMTTVEVLSNIDYGEATVDLFNMDGQKVSSLYAGPVQADQTYRLEVNGANLPSGIYIYSFRAGEDNIFGKVVLIK